MTSTLGFKARADSLVCMLLCLRFTSGVTPTNLLAANMTTKSNFGGEALVWIESRIKCTAVSKHMTRQTFYRLSYAGVVLDVFQRHWCWSLYFIGVGSNTTFLI